MKSYLLIILSLLITYPGIVLSTPIQNAICWAWTSKISSTDPNRLQFGATFFDSNFKELAFIKERDVPLKGSVPLREELFLLKELHFSHYYRDSIHFMVYVPLIIEQDDLSKKYNAMLDANALKNKTTISTATDFQYPQFLYPQHFDIDDEDTYYSSIKSSTILGARFGVKFTNCFGPFSSYGELSRQDWYSRYAYKDYSGIIEDGYIFKNNIKVATEREYSNGKVIRIVTGCVSNQGTIAFEFDNEHLDHLTTYLKSWLPIKAWFKRHFPILTTLITMLQEHAKDVRERKEAK